MSYRGKRVRSRDTSRQDQRDGCLVTVMLWSIAMIIAVGAAVMFIIGVLFLMTEWG